MTAMEMRFEKEKTDKHPNRFFPSWRAAIKIAVIASAQVYLWPKAYLA